MTAPTPHRHHLKPKHRGGTDADGIIEVSTTCHAMFHYCEWRLHGKWEDFTAWKMLCKAHHHPRQGVVLDDSTKQAISKAQKQRLAKQGTWNKGVTGYKTQPATDSRRRKMAHIYIVDGVEYIGSNEAAKSLRLNSGSVVYFRARSDNYPNYTWREDK